MFYEDAICNADAFLSYSNDSICVAYLLILLREIALCSARSLLLHEKKRICVGIYLLNCPGIACPGEFEDHFLSVNQNHGDFSFIRVGAYGIRPTNEHIGGRTNQNHGDFSSVRVGAYGIRPTNRHIGGRTNQKKTGSVVHLPIYDERRANQYILSLFSDGTMGAYAIRPYPDGRRGGVFFVRRRSGMGWLGEGGLLLFVEKMKI